MTEFLTDIFEYRFLANAVAAAILCGVCCGIVGTYMVVRRLVFLGGGITHSSFGGIGLAYYLGVNPLVGAGVFAVLSAVGIEASSRKGEVREDSAIGIMWSVGMAIGILFIYLTPGYVPNLMNFLFGNILTVTSLNIKLLAALALLLVVMFAIWHRQVMFVAFDREYAESQGVRTGLVAYTVAVLTAITIVLSIKAVGIVMLISLLTIPPVIANSLSGSYRKITILSVVIAIVGNLAGLYMSYRMDVPTGAATIFLLTIVLIVVKLVPLCKFKKRKRVR
ncbi:MAG: metal ABC transporter permease [Tidjanibacter sp.]|nr:metal ABC transporter permease [Tidjanibacter sp.]